MQFASCAAAIIAPRGNKTAIRCTPRPNPPSPSPANRTRNRRHATAGLAAAASSRQPPSWWNSRGGRACCRVSALAVACMREGRANGGADREAGGADAGAAATPTEAARRRMKPESLPSSSGSAASSSSGGRGAAEEEQGGRNKPGRRRSMRREDVVRAIRGRLPAAPSCWGNVSVVQERRGRRERPSEAGGGNAGEVQEEGSGPGTATSPAWCCLCPEGDCSLEPNPSANGKEDPGLRSLLERNDFYSDDCNPHAAPAAAVANDDDEVASQGADFD